MEKDAVLKLVKANLLIATNVRDEYLNSIIAGVERELEDEQGLSLKKDDPSHLMFLVDMVVWRYQARDDKGGMPRHLQFRLHNLLVHGITENGAQNG